MSKLYFINYDKLLFSTYTNKTVVISTPDLTKMVSLKKVLDTHKHQHKQWLNKCIQFYDVENANIMKLGTYPSNKMAENDFQTGICHLDVDNPEDLELVNGIHYLSNCDIMVMYNFDLKDNGEDSILSIQGVLVENVNQDVEYDYTSYFDMLYNDLI